MRIILVLVPDPEDWWPSEPAPWASDQEKIAEMLAFIQGGDPSEEV